MYSMARWALTAVNIKKCLALYIKKCRVQIFNFRRNIYGPWCPRQNFKSCPISNSRHRSLPISKPSKILNILKLWNEKKNCERELLIHRRTSNLYDKLYPIHGIWTWWFFFLNLHCLCTSKFIIPSPMHVLNLTSLT